MPFCDVACVRARAASAKGNARVACGPREGEKQHGVIDFECHSWLTLATTREKMPEIELVGVLFSWRLLILFHAMLALL